MKFSEVAVGQKFKIDNVVYTKNNLVKISCCRSANAVKQENNEHLLIGDDQEVELVTE